MTLRTLLIHLLGGVETGSRPTPAYRSMPLAAPVTAPTMAPPQATTRAWLEARPDLKQQVDRHLASGTPVTRVQDWLIKQYDFPHHYSGLRHYKLSLKKGGTS